MDDYLLNLAAGRGVDLGGVRRQRRLRGVEAPAASDAPSPAPVVVPAHRRGACAATRTAEAKAERQDDEVEKVEAREARWAADRDADNLVYEVELISDLPRRVRGLEEEAAEVLVERHEVDDSPLQAVSATRIAVNRTLKEALGSSRLRWWFFRRWGRAKTSPRMREYRAILVGVYENREGIYQAQQEEMEQLAAERVAKRKSAAAIEIVSGER